MIAVAKEKIMSNIANLNPIEIWRNFQTICEIPHPSGCEQRLGEYISEFGRDLGLNTTRDKKGNVIISKPATPGYEGRQTVTLQSHIDK